MLGVKSKNPVMIPAAKGRTAATGGGGREAAAAGGMLVQKRNSDINQISTAIPSNIEVKVKYGSSYHEVNINSQTNYGEMKKMLRPRGMNPVDQELVFKKERELKDGSKNMKFDDAMSREKRVLENIKKANMDKAKKEMHEISLEVDKLVKHVKDLELEICGGKKVEEKILLNFIELFMSQLIKLDGIVADGDAKLERRNQVKRVQRYMETLDMLKIKSSMIKSNFAQVNSPMLSHRCQNKSSFEQKFVAPLEKYRDSMQMRTMMTNRWEKY